jgi:endonuclease/exonuclease/phosphatase (EEP) superfamily protein YafD
MDTSSSYSLVRRWVESLLVWYASGIIFYLIARFIIKADWRWLLLLHNTLPYLFAPMLIALGIALLMRSQRLIGVYLLLSLINTLWIVPILLPALNPPIAKDSQLRLVSFNVFPENSELDRAVEWLLSQDADVIFLQEIPEDTNAFSPLADAYPYSASQDIQTGSAVFSRYPITSEETINLADTPQQRLVLQVNEHEITIYNLHLYMPLNDNEDDMLLLRYDETRRNTQIEQLLSAAAEETGFILLLGDFNMSEFSPIYAQINAQFHDAYRVVSGGIGATWPAGASEELDDYLPPLIRLDYLWYSDGLEAYSASVGTSLGSDHLPFIMEVGFP